MKTKTKIIFGSIAALGVIVIAGIIGLSILWNYTTSKLESPEYRQKNDQGMADGIAFGRTTDQNGCLEKGFSLEAKDSSFDLSNGYFVEKCLTVSRPTPDFCEGVPLISGGNWEENECKKIGRDNEQCNLVMDWKKYYCRSSDAKK